MSALRTYWLLIYSGQTRWLRRNGATFLTPKIPPVVIKSRDKHEDCWARGDSPATGRLPAAAALGAGSTTRHCRAAPPGWRCAPRSGCCGGGEGKTELFSELPRPTPITLKVRNKYFFPIRGTFFPYLSPRTWWHYLQWLAFSAVILNSI